MTPDSRIAAFALALLALGSPAASRGAEVAADGDIIVNLGSDAALEPLLLKHRLTLAGRFGARPIYRVKVIGKDKVKDKIDALERESDVIAAEPNLQYSSPEADKNVVWAIGTARDYVEQWAPQALRLADAQRASDGTGVRVAVLDTGVDPAHPALAGRLLPGYDFVDEDADPSEAGTPQDAGFGHGTHVTGLVALAAPGARIMPLRVLDAAGVGNLWVLAEALLYAVDPDGDPSTDDGAHVINLSLGNIGKTRILETVAKLVTCKKPDPKKGGDSAAYAFDKARCVGIGGAVIVAAAGNGGTDKVREFPAGESVHGLMSVGASDASGRRARFSNYGAWVDVAAPGDAITSTVPGGGYGTWSGTSMAAPFVSGAAALVREKYPGLGAEEVGKRLRERGSKLCGTGLRQVDPLSALADKRLESRTECD